MLRNLSCNSWVSRRSTVCVAEMILINFINPTEQALACCLSWKGSPVRVSCSVFPGVVSNGIRVPGHTLKSFINFELISLHRVRDRCEFNSFTCGYPVPLKSYVKNTSFLQRMLLTTLPTTSHLWLPLPNWHSSCFFERQFHLSIKPAASGWWGAW